MNSVSFTPDGHQVLSGSSDGTVKVKNGIQKYSMKHNLILDIKGVEHEDHRMPEHLQIIGRCCWWGCSHQLRPHSAEVISLLTSASINVLIRNMDQMVVCNRTNTVVIMNMQVL